LFPFFSFNTTCSIIVSLPQMIKRKKRLWL
jgi:hypothetical protein